MKETGNEIGRLAFGRKALFCHEDTPVLFSMASFAMDRRRISSIPRTWYLHLHIALAMTRHKMVVSLDGHTENFITRM